MRLYETTLEGWMHWGKDDAAATFENHQEGTGGISTKSMAIPNPLKKGCVWSRCRKKVGNGRPVFDHGTNSAVSMKISIHPYQ
jgi:hypothetical protein